MPLVYWFGFAQPKKSPGLMERRIKELAERVSQRQKLDPLGNFYPTPVLSWYLTVLPCISTRTRLRSDHRLLSKLCIGCPIWQCGGSEISPS